MSVPGPVSVNSRNRSAIEPGGCMAFPTRARRSATPSWWQDCAGAGARATSIAAPAPCLRPSSATPESGRHPHRGVARHVDVAAIGERAAVAQAPFSRQLGDVIHPPRGPAAGTLIDIASAAPIMVRVADMPAMGETMDLAWLVAAGHQVGDEALEFRRRRARDRDRNAGRRFDR